jgi:GNAT superfamily N-acetyltransferase
VRFLLDTNILIPLEPGADEFGPLTSVAADFHSYLTQGSHQALLHPAYRADLARDEDTGRRKRTEALARKYPELEGPPSVPPDVSALLGDPAPGSNDWVDDQLLAAVAADAVDYLVSEDLGIHRKAARIGLGPRVATLSDAVSVVRGLFDARIAPPPSVASIKAHQLDLRDPIFDGLRTDYPEFDEWMRRIRREGRQCWVILGEGPGYAALAIVKREESGPGIRGKVLKICTFKVAEEHRGRLYGELLLKTLFDYSYQNRYSGLYLTAWPKHVELLQLLDAFGFEQCEQQSNGELVLRKRRVAGPGDEALDALAFHIKFGPPAVRDLAARTLLVPIQPTFHRMLFPELEVSLRGGMQLELLPRRDEPYGNALRKAYLSRAHARSLEPGDLLLFYRSADLQSVTTLGVLEATLASSDPTEIARFVGKRTVYTYPQIETLTRRGAVLALLFRQDRPIHEPIPLAELLRAKVVSGPPQSIMQVSEEGRRWLAQRIDA